MRIEVLTFDCESSAFSIPINAQMISISICNRIQSSVIRESIDIIMTNQDGGKYDRNATLVNSNV